MDRILSPETVGGNVADKLYDNTGGDRSDYLNGFDIPPPLCPIVSQARYSEHPATPYFINSRLPILDIGCGNGFGTRNIRRLVEAGNLVIPIDIQAPYIRPSGMVQASGFYIPLPSKSIGVAVCEFVTVYMTERNIIRLCTEVHRVLSEGGIFFIGPQKSLNKYWLFTKLGNNFTFLGEQDTQSNKSKKLNYW